MTKKTVTDHPSMRVRSTVDSSGNDALEMSVQCPHCESWTSLSSAFEQFLMKTISGAEEMEEEEARTSHITVPRTTLSEIMSRNVICVRPDVPIESIISLFIERRIGGVPVVDEDGQFLGVVTKTDLAQAGLVAGETFTDVAQERVQLTARGGVQYDPGAGYHVTELTRATAGEVMSPQPLTLSPESTVLEAAALMAKRGVHRIVVTRGGMVEGIVSALDVLRWYARNYDQPSEAVLPVAVNDVRRAPEHMHAVPMPTPTAEARKLVESKHDNVRNIDSARGAHSQPPQAGPSPSMRPSAAPWSMNTAPKYRSVTPAAERKKWILVVDDDQDLRDELAELLESEGYTVGKAGNGLEALDQIRRSGAPSLILLDLGMPVMNGWTFQAELRSRPELAETPVVVVSGAHDEPRRVLAKTGAAAYLAKPLTPTNLLGAVHRYCDVS